MNEPSCLYPSVLFENMLLYYITSHSLPYVYILYILSFVSPPLASTPIQSGAISPQHVTLVFFVDL